MAKLFGKNKLREAAQKIDTEEISEHLEIVKKWHADYHKGSLKTDKETSREQAYNQDFFIRILGYKEKPANPYSFEPKASTTSGQLPDAIIGFLEPVEDKGDTKVSAVVELKGASIALDKPQRREGNMSPVQQGFKYKTQYKNCPFVIVSNFYEFRLYQDNQLDYELWTLDDLLDPADDYLKFKSFYQLLRHVNFVPLNGEGRSKTEELLSDIRIEQEEIGKKFYKAYKQARLELLRDMYKNNKVVRDDINVGIEKAQKIIDRIVFVCFAEDRGLLPDNTLAKVLQIDESAFGSLWDTLKGFFNAIDTGSQKLEIPDGYNGGLFATDSELNSLGISDEPLKHLAQLSRYDFEEELSVQILGHIFEQSISDLEEIKEKAEKVVEETPEKKTSKRKKDGIFYTPDYIVRYIVENSLGKYLREAEEKCKSEAGLKGDINDKNYQKREKQAYLAYQKILQNVTVCDPACGSGAFLVYVFDYLLAENQRVSAIINPEQSSLLDTDTYFKSILENNIYGVDLNSESVEITKLSLWLKSAQKGKKLTSLNSNIKCGNSVVDNPVFAGEKAFNWKEEFTNIFDNGGFDVVVGNPPYVRQEHLKPYKKHFETYETFSSSADLYTYFIELGVDKLINNQGIYSIIVANKWMKAKYGKPLRKWLKEKGIFEIIDFKDLPVFEGATAYPCILTVNQNSSVTDFRSVVVNDLDFSSLDQYVNSSYITVEKEHLEDEIWTLSDKNIGALMRKLSTLKGTTKLKSYIDNRMYVGLKTGYNKAFIVDEDKYQEFIKTSDKYRVIVKPYVVGRDIKRYGEPEVKSYLICIPSKWTRTESSANTEEDAWKWIKDNYPLITDHLSIYEAQCRKRSDQGEFWWALRACDYYEEFEGTKIIYSEIASKGKFTIDDNGLYCDMTAFIIGSESYSLLGLLNSRLFTFMFEQSSSEIRGGFLRWKRQYLYPLPIPDLSTKPQIAEHAKDVKSLVSDRNIAIKRLTDYLSTQTGSNDLSKKLIEWYKLNYDEFLLEIKKSFRKTDKQLTKSDELEWMDLFSSNLSKIEAINESIDPLEQKIDRLIYSLYELTPEEIKIVENAQ